MEQACGFELVFEEAEEGGPSEGFAVLPEHSELALLQAALQLMGQCPPAPASAPSLGANDGSTDKAQVLPGFCIL